MKMIANVIHTTLLLLLSTSITTITFINATNNDDNNIYENASITITGNLKIWDAIFSSRNEPKTIISASSHDDDEDNNHHNLIWTEGPTLIGTNLYFSDTVGAKIYALDVSSFEKKGKEASDDDDENDRPQLLRVVKDKSGDNPIEDDDWRAEPGSNGLFFLPSPPSTTSSSKKDTLLVCQHGARRVAGLDVTFTNEKEKEENKRTIPLASEWNGRKLNGPNDIVIRYEKEEGGGGGNKVYAYFTDPVYAWLEKNRFQDLPYLDERVKSSKNNGGPGHCGVYKFRLEWRNGKTAENGWGRVGEVELVHVMDRPNGIGFLDMEKEEEEDGGKEKKSKMIVSDCCQGSHLENCKQGTSRWTTFDQNKKREWIKNAVIESTLDENMKELYGEGKGCADGFAIHHYNIDNDTTIPARKKQVLIASCSEGLCIVDVEQERVVTRLWTVKKSGCKVSNVAIGKEWVYLTGNCGIQGLPLRRKDQAVHTEL